jgi:hypothetical protein
LKLFGFQSLSRMSFSRVGWISLAVIVSFVLYCFGYWVCWIRSTFTWVSFWGSSFTFLCCSIFHSVRLLFVRFRHSWSIDVRLIHPFIEVYLICFGVRTLLYSAIHLQQTAFLSFCLFFAFVPLETLFQGSLLETSLKSYQLMS